jgi:hypothetical protein
MKKILIFISVFVVLLHAKDVKPDFSLKASGGVTDMVLVGEKLYASTDASCVNIYDIKQKKEIDKICVSKIKDFMGDDIDSKIYSIDVLDGALLILSQDGGGYRRVDIVKDSKVSHIITKDDHLYISRAKFIDKDTILLGLLSNVIISFDIKTKKYNLENQPTESKFSFFVLNKEKTKVITTDESGDLQMLDIKNGKLLKSFTGLNVDNVFQVDWKKDTIATAGQDRRCVIYNAKTTKGYYKQATFLIYSVGLSPNGDIAGFASDEQNNVTIFNTFTKSDKAKLLGNKANISNILFVNENEVFVSCDTDEINHYKF